MLIRATRFFAFVLASARLLTPHALSHNRLHARQRVLNVGPTGNLSGRELVPAQAAGQIRPELKLPQPDLKQLLAVRTGQIDPCAPVILEQADSSG